MNSTTGGPARGGSAVSSRVSTPLGMVSTRRAPSAASGRASSSDMAIASS